MCFPVWVGHLALIQQDQEDDDKSFLHFKVAFHGRSPGAAVAQRLALTGTCSGRAVPGSSSPSGGKNIFCSFLRGKSPQNSIIYGNKTPEAATMVQCVCFFSPNLADLFYPTYFNLFCLQTPSSSLLLTLPLVSKPMASCWINARWASEKWKAPNLAHFSEPVPGHFMAI